MPSLKALRAFDAVARHASFTLASEECHLTPAAVSYHIAQLEALLGVRLLERSARSVTLTDRGRTLLGYVRAGLHQIERGVETISGGSARALNVSVGPSFAQKWLLPRLADFSCEHPDIDIRLNATNRLVDFSRDDIDVAIRYGPGGWHDLLAEKLLDESVFPVCSPAFMARYGPFRTPRALLACALLHDPSLPWEGWFAAFGVSPRDVPGGAEFDDANLMLIASESGQGLALARSVLAAESVALGRLVIAFDHRLSASFSYYLVYPPQNRELARVEAFRRWILRRCREDRELPERHATRR